MSNARKKVKKEKKEKARKDKAKLARAKHVEARKADQEHEKRSPARDKPGFNSSWNKASSKPSGRASSPERRTQGK